MTDEQKRTIQTMRDEELTFSAISVQLHISENTIKSFCRRTKIKVESIKSLNGDICKNCGKELNRNPKHKVQKFCSDDCRLAWWAKNRDFLNRTAIYKITCAYCNNEFESYGNKHRKYCGHACYIKDRFEGNGLDDTRTICTGK